MLTNLVNIFSNTVTPKNLNPVKQKPLQTSSNPFANPFMNADSSSSSNYAKNNPVKGGYFAGYYNGVPNIVGAKLFLEV